MICSYLLNNLISQQLTEINGLHKEQNLTTRVISDHSLSNKNLTQQKRTYQKLNCNSFIIHLDIEIKENKNKFMWMELVDNICFALDNIVDQNIVKINLHFKPIIILNSINDYRKYLTDSIALVIEKLQLSNGILNIQHFDSVDLFEQSLICANDLHNSFKCKLTIEPALLYQKNLDLLKQEGQWNHLCDMFLINDYSMFTNEETIPGNGITPFASLMEVIETKSPENYAIFYPKILKLDSMKNIENYFNNCDEYFLKNLKKID